MSIFLTIYFLRLKHLKNLGKRKTPVFTEVWSERQDLNLRPLGPEPSALPPELRPVTMTFYHSKPDCQPRLRLLAMRELGLWCGDALMPMGAGPILVLCSFEKIPGFMVTTLRS